MTKQQTSQLSQLVYISSASADLSQEELAQILKNAQRKNAELEITGILLYKDGNIMQVLEGDKVSITRLMRAISMDPRHRGVIELLHERINERQFPSWSMAYKRLNDDEASGFADFFSHASDNYENSVVSGRAKKLIMGFRDNML